jgi:branched-chain amino acid transport system permease protein
MSTVTLTNTLISAVVLGSIFSLVALGFVVVYRASKVFNFLHPEFMYIGVLIVTSLQGATGQFFVWAVLAALAAVVAFSCATYMVIIYRTSSQPHWMQMILTFGLGIVVLNLAQLFWGAGLHFLHPPMPSGQWSTPGGGVLSASDAIIVAIAVALNAALFWVLTISPIAIRLKATAEDATLASYFGIKLRIWFSVAWGLAAAAAVVAGITYSTRVPADAGLTDVGLLVFPAAIIGGMDSIAGAYIGSYILALVNQFASALFGADAATPLTFAVVLLVLVFRPGGLLGSPVVERV